MGNPNKWFWLNTLCTSYQLYKKIPQLDYYAIDDKNYIFELLYNRKWRLQISVKRTSARRYALRAVCKYFIEEKSFDNALGIPVEIEELCNRFKQLEEQRMEKIKQQKGGDEVGLLS